MWNPEQVRYPSGPNCEGCPFRGTSRGFAPPQGYTAVHDEDSGAWLYEPGPLWLSAEYLFQAEGLGKDEARQGANLVGGTGGIFNMLLHQNTSLHRTQVAITNTVHCRPIKHVNGVPVKQSNGDYVNAKPEPAQIRECYERYGKAELAAFNGTTLVGLGAATLSLFAPTAGGILKNAGTIFEPGVMVPCPTCEGVGHLDRPRKNCPACKKTGHVKCDCGGVSKHRKKCLLDFRPCPDCDGVRTLARPPRVCPQCHGEREVPSDPNNPYVSKLLKPGQILFPTLHPAFLMRSPQSKKLLSLHFSRITSLREELEVEDTTAYHRDPSSEILSDVFSHSALSVDLETTGFVPERGEIEMVGASIGPGQSIVAVGESRHAYEWLKRAETDESITVIGQNWMQYDAWWVWQKWGIGPPARCFDTRLAGHLLNPDTPNNIIYLTQEFAKPPIRGYWKTRNHYRDDKIGVCLIDCDATFRVERGQETQLLDENLMGEYWNEVYPVMKVAFNMRRGGWRVDRPALAIANTRVAASVVEGRKALPEWPGVGKTDIRTENQHEAVKDYLYTTLRLPVQLNSKTHQPASGWEEMTELDTRLKNGHSSVEHLTSAEVAEALRFIPLVLGLRDQSKLLTFLNPDSQFLSPKNFFHPTWNPAGTATFRFACQDPNLMQVPKCTCDPTCYGENPKCVNARFPFIGDEDGWVIGSTDYSQIEVIGFLWAAGQWDVLRRVLLEGLDAHAVMGEQMGMMRKDAKHMTFALVYGASDETIAAKSGKPVHVVAEARAHYMKVFSGVKEFRWRYISQAMEHGFVESPFGRRRYLWVQQPIGRAANQAANAPIQGIPPMIVRRAMIRLDKELPKPARILGNIHDELVWTCPKEMLPEVVECITDVMRSPIPEMPAMPLGMGTGLVLNVDTEVGPDWSRCVKYETTKN